MPVDRLEVVMANGAVTRSVYDWNPSPPLLLMEPIVNADTVVVFGVPEIVPELVKMRPEGSVPETRDQPVFCPPPFTVN